MNGSSLVVVYDIMNAAMYIEITEYLSFCLSESILAVRIG